MDVTIPLTGSVGLAAASHRGRAGGGRGGGGRCVRRWFRLRVLALLAAAGGHHLGLAATFSVAVIPVLVLTAWIAAAVWAARRWFRRKPRR